VLLREITSEPPYCLKSVYISEPFLNNKSILNILHPENNIDELKCLLGILNSKLLSLYYKQRAVKSARKIFPKVVIKNLREFPYPIIGSSIQSKRLVQLVDCTLDFNKRLNKTKVPLTRKQLQRQINAIDRQIDQLVYHLYGLTEEEIRIVEGNV
jgi:adenine-specific DNA-methyltransferase